MWRNWTTHNLIAHPLSEIAHLLGLDETLVALAAGNPEIKPHQLERDAG